MYMYMYNVNGTMYSRRHKKFPYRLRSVLRAICVGFALGNRAVCVGFAWGLRSMYCPFTVCLIIRYRNSGTLRVRVQGSLASQPYFSVGGASGEKYVWTL